MSKRRLQHFGNGSWSLLMEQGNDSKQVEFWIAAPCGWEPEDTKLERPLYGEWAEGEPEPEHSDKALKESAELSGFIKWDGCSHMKQNFDVMVHICGLSNWKALAEAFTRIPVVAAEWGIEEN